MDIRELKDKHKGQRCFLVGTGPSLNSTRLDLIKGETVFGVNTLYKGLSRFGISCNYYGVADDALLRSPATRRHIFNLRAPLFLSTSACKFYQDNRRLFQNYRQPILLPRLSDNRQEGSFFSFDASKGTYFGMTVIFDVGLQVAYYLGFDKVYLLGCDCDYSGAHSFNGDKTSRPEHGGAAGNWTCVFRAYNTAKQAYEENGREIVNSTVGGKLEIFRRESLEHLFGVTNGTT